MQQHREVFSSVTVYASEYQFVEINPVILWYVNWVIDMKQFYKLF